TLLLEKPGEVLTREELTKRLWPDETYGDFERGLNKAVTRLRDALRDSAENPRYIETLPRRGYRFIAPIAISIPVACITPVAEVETKPEKVPTPENRNRSRHVALLAAGLIAVLLVVGSVVWWKWNVGTVRAARVARFRQLTHDGQAKRGPLAVD